MNKKELIETYKDCKAIGSMRKLLINLNLRPQFIYSGFLEIDEILRIFRKDCDIHDKMLLVQDKSFVSFLMKQTTQNDFNAFIDLISRQDCLKVFLGSSSFFEHFIEADESTKLDKISYLLNKIQTASEVEYLIDNNKLFEEVLKNYILKQKRIEKLGSNFFKVAKNRYEDHLFLKSYLISNEDAKKVIDLVDLYEKMSNFRQFSHDQQKEIFSIVRTQPKSKEIFLTILNNNLESMYQNFDNFKKLLTKAEKKSRLKLNV